MRTPVYTNRFEKDLNLMIKRGSDPEGIKSIVRKLIEEIPLERKHRDHLLIGNFKDHINDSLQKGRLNRGGAETADPTAR